MSVEDLCVMCVRRSYACFVIEDACKDKHSFAWEECQESHERMLLTNDCARFSVCMFVVLYACKRSEMQFMFDSHMGFI